MQPGKIHKRTQPRGNRSESAYPKTNAIADARATCPDGNEPLPPKTVVSLSSSIGNSLPRYSMDVIGGILFGIIIAGILASKLKLPKYLINSKT